ncbi:Subtilisin-like protease [Morella rubra]|uniref:Subtilisin-like protease n=1 Tax=Morella rubra TaxID=262757 RepID=A0A6A1WIN3_9ROSI|nr:Subtilisin-like protease [Morella rubra]KAB1225199.1 Subtilisin-like protease [Morella rubra]
MAPGALVLASWPPNVPVAVVDSQPLFSNFNLLSGTSMSCPHAAGVAALIKEVHPEWSPAAIWSAMMTTSDAMDNTYGPIKDIGRGDVRTSPLAMGAGHINPNKAINPGLIYDAKSEETDTNVVEGKSTYVARVTPMKGVHVSVTPDKLVFEEKNENHGFKLSIEGPRRLADFVVFGFLSWVDTAGKHVVRSPMVAKRISSDLLPQS